MKTPPGITYQAEYEPDMEKMVKALKIVQEAPNSEKVESKELEEGA
ncbi:hypothetical protein PAEVO_28800 [Paenibacillus sp. GM2FR]|nr:hypothetical protein [Paenibacillus sp. GM2FR]PJN56157.1 hypothetical protein PAEVO_28800 [Paenibacillus sp. GM2FR]